MKLLKNHIFPVLLMVFLVLFLENYSHHLAEETKWYIIVFAFILFALIIVSAEFFTNSREREELQKLIEQQQDIIQELLLLKEEEKSVIDHADNLIQRLPTTWICEDSEFAKIESKCKGNIMVVSPDLSNVKGIFKEVVKKNMKKGIIYTYVIPESNTIKTTIHQLLVYFKPYDINFKTEFLDSGHFKMLTSNHITILNFDSLDGSASAYLQQPVAKKPEEKDIKFWIMFDEFASNDWVKRVNRMLDERDNKK